MWTNYLPGDLKPFQGKHRQHLNHVSCDLISGKKILLLEFGFSFCKQQMDGVLPGYDSIDTPELCPGLKNCNFLQNAFSVGLENNQKSCIYYCQQPYIFAFLSIIFAFF